MGKEDEEQPPGSGGGGAAAPPPERSGAAGSCRRCITLRCAAALLLGAAVLLSAVFWLPPFATWHHGLTGPGTDSMSGDIVASFRLQRTKTELKGNISKLEYDIYEEIGVPNTTVAVISLERVNGSDNNTITNVIFTIWSYPKKSSTISPTGISLLRSSLTSLVVQQSTLYLTEPLFGNSTFFEILKFPGGITIIPPQNVFLLLMPQPFFNFTLNFPIYKVQDKIDELKDQMKRGLHLNSYENLFIKLTNLEGSTVNLPTIVQTSIVLKVGNHEPSLPRLKQLAQTINSSSRSNLGLNHTVFGRVKQISLSSFLNQTLDGPTAPSPAPNPNPNPNRHRHHRHKTHSNNRNHNPNPPVPAPKYTYPAPPPSRCRFGHYPIKPKNGPPPEYRYPAPPPVRNSGPAQAPARARARARVTPVVSESPLPSVSFGHVNPPSESEAGNTEPPAHIPATPPQPNSYFGSRNPGLGWYIAPVLYILLLGRLQ